MFTEKRQPTSVTVFGNTTAFALDAAHHIRPGWLLKLFTLCLCRITLVRVVRNTTVHRKVKQTRSRNNFAPPPQTAVNNVYRAEIIVGHLLFLLTIITVRAKKKKTELARNLATIRYLLDVEKYHWAQNNIIYVYYYYYYYYYCNRTDPRSGYTYSIQCWCCRKPGPTVELIRSYRLLSVLRRQPIYSVGMAIVAQLL